MLVQSIYTPRGTRPRRIESRWMADFRQEIRENIEGDEGGSIDRCGWVRMDDWMDEDGCGWMDEDGCG